MSIFAFWRINTCLGINMCTWQVKCVLYIDLIRYKATITSGNKQLGHFNGGTLWFPFFVSWSAFTSGFERSCGLLILTLQNHVTAWQWKRGSKPSVCLARHEKRRSLSLTCLFCHDPAGQAANYWMLTSIDLLSPDCSTHSVRIEMILLSTQWIREVQLKGFGSRFTWRAVVWWF